MSAGGFGAVWDTFCAGESTTDLIVGGHPMLYWGRIGKVMQFAAGLVAILDLIGTKRLERAVISLRAGYARRVAAVDVAAGPYHYAALRIRIAKSFHWETVGGPEGGAERGLVTGPPPDLGAGCPLDRDAFEAWWTDRLAALHAGTAVGGDADATEEMLRILAPPEDRPLLDGLTWTVSRVGCLQAVSGMTAFAGAFVTLGWLVVASRRYDGQMLSFGVLLKGIAVVGGAIVLAALGVALIYDEYAPADRWARMVFRAAMWLPRLPPALAVQVVAVAFDRAALPIRLAALLVFVAGFAADLLAS